ncbi:DUF1206 domain-containing protein [Streptomyces sp. NPDC050504]|uniref:DUF1206 domain-containing protein n=1 Tax=Streptomyces sp. NPDC050504 TaxID=3365618 RepID=UPI0037A57515
MTTTTAQAGNTTLEAGARWGFAARGVLYVLVGALALRVAFGGDDGKEADRSGALAELAEKPLGTAMLWVLGIGLVGMALWRLSEAVFGSETGKRLLQAGRAVFYGFVAYSVLAFAAGDRGGGGGGGGAAGGSSDEKSRDVTARALELPGGQWIVGAAGAALIGFGLVSAGRAALRKYHKHLKLGEMSRRVRRAADVTGVGGGVARGLLFAAAGTFAVRAAVRYEPDEAKGVDDTLRAFADTPAGPWLLALMALGLVLFGLFSFVMARWRRV